MLKRGFDLIVSLLLLLTLWPALLLIAVLVLVFLGRPVLFRQARPGMNGRPFTILKFRTMVEARDTQGNRLPDAARLTALGRFLRSLSLDELPELLNVVIGDMSLVGPRPLLMEYLPLYSPRQAHRHAVRPGITGWAQVNGRNALSWEDKFELDIWYVENQSMWLDLQILWMTAGKVIRREGINQYGSDTMERFKGSNAGMSR
jgi:lipopolysaccharide/colanic/teichoic acid biosynthesis glycosyltransferase